MIVIHRRAKCFHCCSCMDVVWIVIDAEVFPGDLNLVSQIQSGSGSGLGPGGGPGNPVGLGFIRKLNEKGTLSPSLKVEVDERHGDVALDTGAELNVLKTEKTSNELNSVPN